VATEIVLTEISDISHVSPLSKNFSVLLTSTCSHRRHIVTFAVNQYVLCKVTF
jgi:hypothetical protein